MNKLQGKQVKTLQEALSKWYRRHKRDLPWRRNRDPYGVWISEIMLQQTRVDQARPFYEQFMRLFPDVGSLARERRDAVMKAWEGMGYYSRARNLHRAAKMIVDDFGGKIPRTKEDLLKLPGVGLYTAGAIASIAFGKDEPVLDGNVTRILCRLFAIRADPKAGKTRNRLWSLAREIMPFGKAGRFNEALMDLGAMVCLPRNPLCPECPFEKTCLARARNQQHLYPRKPPKKTVPHLTVVAAVIRRNGRILIDQRKSEGLLGGLWEFPGGKVEEGETLKQALRREIREELTLKIRVGPELVVVNHAYTHFRITLHAFECTLVSGQAKALGCAAFKWVRLSEMVRFAFPAANHKIIAALKDKSGV